MRFLIASLGTLGDALPFLALAKSLQKRGHEVLVLGNGYYRNFVEKEGLATVDLISRRTFEDFLGQASLWADADQFVVKNLQNIVPVLCRRVHRAIVSHGSPADTIIVAHDYLFGARVAQETHGFRLATVHLQPSWMRSVHDPPRALPQWPRSVVRVADGMFDMVLDARVGKIINKFRGSFGLAPVSRITKSWWRSSDLVLALFPEWLGPRQPDWPPQTVQTGFPFFTSDHEEFDTAKLDAFLDAGSPPLVFTQSSATKDAHTFYQVGVEICQLMDRRGILLTSQKEQVPKPLPDNVVHFPYLPMQHLLPRCALHVNHGGMGSVAWTLAAGIPQLNVPWGFDQIDTSTRLRELGVADMVRPSQFTASRVRGKISKLLRDPKVHRRCQELAVSCQKDDALGTACSALERLGSRSAAMATT